MSCAERKDLILLYVFDQLEPDEAASLAAHLREGCPRCNGELAAARTLSGQLALSAPPVIPSPALKERVLNRIAESKVVPFRGTQPAAPKSAPRRWPAVGAAALLAASVAAIAILIPARHEIEALRGRLATAREAVAALEARAASAEAALRSLGSPATRMTALEAAGPDPDVAGRLFREESNGAWRVFFSRMKPTRAGRTYELWFVTADQRKVPAGTFDVGADGEASLVVTPPADLGPIAFAAVTEEPAGGVPQPTGAILLVGKLGT
ncbi:MAG TPA: anti-sigma factor [Candidatus Sulfotelmatobacter sp.]|nr:anti-sigma factor [Candidatus Sulfotelmatobacter sp.]